MVFIPEILGTLQRRERVARECEGADGTAGAWRIGIGAHHRPARHPGGRVPDLRRMMRAEMRRLGEPTPLAYRERKKRLRRL